MSATTSSSTTTTTSRTEHIYVLYGSQTGNSEQAARELCSQIPTKLSPSAIAQVIRGVDGAAAAAHNIMNDQVTASHMQLDDFLELEQCKWTRVMVIITSSYGIGQAPLGCYRFRDLCDAWLDEQRQMADAQPAAMGGADSSSSYGVLRGVKYAMCGLGDSKYTTFFRNPATIDAALTAVGAERIGDLGKADASGVGDQVQSKVIEQWMDGIWKHLALALIQDPPLPSERLLQMQKETIELCRKINPEFPRPDDIGTTTERGGMLMALLVVLLAIVAGYYFYAAHRL